MYASALWTRWYNNAFTVLLELSRFYKTSAMRVVTWLLVKCANPKKMAVSVSGGIRPEELGAQGEAYV